MVGVDGDLFFDGVKMIKGGLEAVSSWGEIGCGFVFNRCAIEGDFGAIRGEVDVDFDLAGATNESDDGINDCDKNECGENNDSNFVAAREIFAEWGFF